MSSAPGRRRQPGIRIGNRSKANDRARAEICILAGGLSSRMGRDKARLRLGGRTLLSRVREIAAATGLPFRVIRDDLVPRCGPLGGVYSALKTTAFDHVLFLACDMPLVSLDLLTRMLPRPRSARRALFVARGTVVGFPFVLGRETLPGVQRLLVARRLSLQELACLLRARRLLPSRAEAATLLNINTPADWRTVQRSWRLKGSPRARQRPPDSAAGARGRNFPPAEARAAFRASHFGHAK